MVNDRTAGRHLYLFSLSLASPTTSVRELCKWLECTVPNFVADVNAVASAVDHPAGGQAAERAGRGSVIGLDPQSHLFRRQKLSDSAIGGTEAKLPIEPEGARFDGFL